MYSSSSSSFDPFHYSHNPTHFPFLNFSSPNFLDENGDLHLSDPSLIHQQHPNSGASNNQDMISPTPAALNNKAATTMNTNYKKTKAAKTSNGSSTKKQAPAPKRSGKKDRHSKIYTAQGPRDRRMRLSLQIARKFFDLQDMLGFDKASKTIDWLFSKSKLAIKEVTDNFCDSNKSLKRSDSGCGKSSVYSSSESEVMSGIPVKLLTTMGDHHRRVTTGTTEKRSSSSSKKQEVFSPLGKESRDMARARARERTKEKLKIKSKRPNPNNNLEQLGAEDGKSLDLKDQEEEEDEEEEEKKVEGGITEKYLAQMGSCSSSSISNIVDRYLGVSITAAGNETKSTSIFDICHHENIAADFEVDPFSGFPGNCIGRSVQHNNNRYKLSTTTTTGDVYHDLENPNSSIFINNHNPPPTSSQFQDHHQNLGANSLLMANQEHNSASLFLMNLNTPLFPILSQFTNENHFSTCNPNLPIKYDDTLY